MNVETNLTKIEGIDSGKVNLEAEQVILSGGNVNLLKVKETAEGIGYKFENY